MNVQYASGCQGNSLSLVAVLDTLCARAVLIKMLEIAHNAENNYTALTPLLVNSPVLLFIPVHSVILGVQLDYLWMKFRIMKKPVLKGLSDAFFGTNKSKNI